MWDHGNFFRIFFLHFLPKLGSVWRLFFVRLEFSAAALSFENFSTELTDAEILDDTLKRSEKIDDVASRLDNTRRRWKLSKGKREWFDDLMEKEMNDWKGSEGWN